MKKQICSFGYWVFVLANLIGFPYTSYSQFHEVDKVVASDGSSGDLFGQRVAISGNYAIIGAFSNDIPGSGSVTGSGAPGIAGAVYFFERSGSSWNETSLFTPAFLYVPETNLGFSVAIDGEMAVAGAYYLDNVEDAVYVYQHSGGVWNHLIRLHEGPQNSGFGSSVDISGNRVIVGAPNGGAGSLFGKGSAYIYEYNGSPGFSGWTEKSTLVSSDAPAPNFFGSAVAISGDYAAISATGDLNDQSGQGVFVYERNTSGTWNEVVKLESPAMSLTENFGLQIAMEENTLVVGSPNTLNGGVSTGAVYVYERSSSGIWNLTATIFADDGALYDSFGGQVDIEDGRIIVGSRQDDDDGNNSGAAYIYEKVGGAWSLVGKWTASDAATDDEFGSDVGITSNYAVVGAHYDDDLGSFSGSAYFLQHELVIPPIRPILLLRIFPNPNYGEFILAAIEISIGNQTGKLKTYEETEATVEKEAEDKVNIDLKNMKIESSEKILQGTALLTIKNEKGETLIERKIKLPFLNKINLTKYGPGIYFVTVKTKDNKKTRRILVKER